MRPEVERVQTLLSDTVTLLCKNGLTYEKEMKVQGLLGISLDENEVFVVHINELFSQTGATLDNIQAVAAAAEEDSLSAEETVHKPKKSDSSSKNKRPHSNASVDLTLVKTEKDDVIMLDTKPEPGSLSSNEHGPSSKRRMLQNPVLQSHHQQQHSQQQQLSHGSLPPPSGPYITGIVQHNVPDNPNATWDGTQPPNTHLAAVNTLASVMTSSSPVTTMNNNSGGVMPVLNQSSASWGDPNRQLPSPNMQGQDMVGQAYGFLGGLSGKTRRNDGQKNEVCTMHGCGKRFFHRTDLYRHQRIKHGAAHKRRGSIRRGGDGGGGGWGRMYGGEGDDGGPPGGMLGLGGGVAGAGGDYLEEETAASGPQGDDTEGSPGGSRGYNDGQAGEDNEDDDTEEQSNYQDYT